MENGIAKQENARSFAPKNGAQDDNIQAEMAKQEAQ